MIGEGPTGQPQVRATATGQINPEATGETRLADLVVEYDDLAAATMGAMTRERDRRLTGLVQRLREVGVDVAAYTDEAELQLGAGLDLLSLASWLMMCGPDSPEDELLAARLVAGLSETRLRELRERVLADADGVETAAAELWACAERGLVRLRELEEVAGR